MSHYQGSIVVVISRIRSCRTKFYHCQINTWALLWVFCWFITIICCPVDVCSIWWPPVLGVAFDGGEEPCWSIFLLCKNKVASMNGNNSIKNQQDEGYTVSYIRDSPRCFYTRVFWILLWKTRQILDFNNPNCSAFYLLCIISLPIWKWGIVAPLGVE